ncbi:MAG: hypothetical protein KatS3mg076_1041 [Candidatus Binatia bacterium]|nr:MAG: hypothetical protein KatS3mg076_1041 [Candidatus Binatia bacterium]
MRRAPKLFLLGCGATLLLVLAPGRSFAAPGFLCSGGVNDGQECDFDSDCPGGACLAGQNVCNGGTEDGAFCETNADCGGGICALTARVCDRGQNRGFACVRDAHCPGGSCIANGLFCFGGDFDRFACVVDEDCVPEEGEAGTCRGPAEPLPFVTVCSAGPRDGEACELDEECPAGACVLAQNVCDGGPNDGFFCESDTDCSPGDPCTATQRVCDANSGEQKGVACLRNAHCGSGACVSTGRVCFSGDFEFFSCVDDADCASEEEESCLAPGGVSGPTPTFTRRPTPIPTPTRTRPAGAPTPTRTEEEPREEECDEVVGTICVRKEKEGCQLARTSGSGWVAPLLVFLLFRIRRRQARGIVG